VPPVLLFAIVYHIECASTYYNTKNQVLKKAETNIKKALLGAGLGFSSSFMSFDFLFANFGSSQRDIYIQYITTHSKIYDT
jgi:hypothetical protein